MSHGHDTREKVNHLAMTQEDYKHHVSAVYKVTIILSIVTILEVVMALGYETYLTPMGYPMWIIRILLIAFSVVKAYYIMAVFMHLKYETSAMRLTVLLPFTMLIWMIIAFLWDGSSWNNYHFNRFGAPDKTIIEDQAKHNAHGEHEGHGEGHEEAPNE